MTAFVFIGPTLTREEARPLCDAVYLPPARQGDVYRVALQHPQAIGIIDGYFEGTPAVWHKEILWAMAQGIHVFGAASMGALRAAELAPFGMRGVGKIFEAYRAGLIEDDDEVAVVHGPPELGYRARTEALINIRATLLRAEEAGVIDSATKSQLEAIGKALFYQQRTYSEIVNIAARHGLSPAMLESLRAWLVGQRVDQKRLDACAMLTAMKAWLAGKPEPMRVEYRFEYTEAWDKAMALTAIAEGGAAAHPLHSVLDELRLAGRYADIRRKALLRALTTITVNREGLALDRDTLGQTRDAVRRRLGLWSRTDLDQWLSANDLDAAGFERIVTDEARLSALEKMTEPKLIVQMGDVLRSEGDYTSYSERAQHKHALLSRDSGAEPLDFGITMLGVIAWYFERRLGREIPHDMEVYASSIGFTSTQAFFQALLHEYRYCELCDSESNDNA